MSGPSKKTKKRQALWGSSGVPGRGVEQSKVSHGREGYIVGIDEKLGLAGTPHVVEAYIHGAAREEDRLMP